VLLLKLWQVNIVRGREERQFPLGKLRAGAPGVWVLAGCCCGTDSSLVFSSSDQQGQCVV